MPQLNKYTMRYYTKKGRSYEAQCINKIELGIRAIENGSKTGEEVAHELEFAFNKLEEINEAMYNDLYNRYCIARLEAENITCIV